MIVFFEPKLSAEFDRMDWRLQELVHYAERELGHTHQCDLLVTSIERTSEETRRIYQRAGLTPPQSSVHDVRPCRGLDAVPYDLDDDPDAVGRSLAAHLSARWVYPRGHSVCLWHAVSGPHWHFQVPWDALQLAPGA